MGGEFSPHLKRAWRGNRYFPSIMLVLGDIIFPPYYHFKMGGKSKMGGKYPHLTKSYHFHGSTSRSPLSSIHICTFQAKILYKHGLGLRCVTSDGFHYFSTIVLVSAVSQKNSEANRNNLKVHM